MLKRQGLAIAVSMMLVTGISKAEDPTESYDNVKGEILANDRASREFMAKLYGINSRMKTISKKRDRLSNKMINTEANVKALAKSTAVLEETIRVQRQSLSKRIRTLYMLGEDKFLRAIFSANNSEDLQQMLKYLKLFSEQEYHLLRSYESNLKILVEKRDRLQKNVRNLIAIKKNLDREEQYLVKDQKAKSDFLRHLSADRKKSLRKLTQLKKGITTDILDISFFEKKGKLPSPFNGWLEKNFGMVEHPKYHYRLSHKGHLYKSKTPQPVKAVAKGRVVYFGEVSGYGKTAVLDHGDHYYSVYSGLEDLKVKKGESVKASQILSANVNEVYFELRHFSDAIDPQQWMKR